MKKVITKLMVRREAIRTLADGDLAAAAGGGQGNCTAMTQLASGCFPPQQEVVRALSEKD
jgi:hypothetical protein